MLNLFLSSHISDIDIAVSLTDVYPDGKSLLVVEGLTKVDVSEDQQGKSQEIAVDLWSTSLVFAKGHSIRIAIAGSNYPRHEKSLQKVTADSQTCRILVGEKTPSCVILPIVRKGTNWLAKEKPAEVVGVR